MSPVKKTAIKNVHIYDPSRGLKGEKGEIYLSGGKITAPFGDPDLTIDGEGRSLFAGAIEPFSLAATPGREILRINNRIPSPEETGRAYARCGYVHIHQPIMTLLTAKAVWHTLNKIPYVDKSAWVSVDFRDMGKYIKGNNPAEFTALSKALIQLSGGIGLLLPFPYLKHKQRHYMHMNISQKKTLEFISGIREQGILPVNLWGQPGLLESDFPGPENFHIADAGQACTSEDAVNNIKKFLDSGGSATVRLNHGQDTLTVRPLFSHAAGGFSLDTGLHYPLHFSMDKTPLDDKKSELAWKLIEEKNPDWRLSISAADICGTPIDRLREIYSGISNAADFKINLYEFAKRTRIEPARLLGINDIGHLKPGARANITIYDFTPASDSREIFSLLTGCWMLIKDGVTVIRDGEFTGDVPPAGPVVSDINIDVSQLVKSDLLQRPTMRWENLAVNS